MRILLINIYWPDTPPTDGASLRIVALCEELSKRHVVGFLLLQPINASREGINRHRKLFDFVEIIPIPDKRSLWIRRKCGELLASFKTKKIIAQIIKQKKIDVIHYHYPSTALLVGPVRDIPCVLDLVDSQVLYHERDQARRKNHSVIGRFWSKIRIQRIQRQEVNMIRSYPATCVVSPADKEKILSYNLNQPVECIANGVDTHRFMPGILSSLALDIGFVGNMYFPPNIDAMLYFCHEIFPLITKRLPKIRMWIVGKRPVPDILALSQNPNVKVTGTVADVRPYLEKFAVFVAPMRLGGGIKNKILEAFSMERPVVTSNLGIEAIQAASDGKNVVVADTYSLFANAVIELLEAPKRRDEMGYCGRKLVEDHYSWEETARKYGEVYKTLKEGLNLDQQPS